MNILFLFISLPKLENTSIFSDLIKEFAKNGHNVKVATPLSGSDQPEGIRIEAGIEVLRFRTDQLTGNKSMIKKGLAYLKLLYQYPRAIKKYFGKEKIDVIIGHSLPPELGIIIPRLKRYFGAKFYLMLCEFIWQDAVALGMFSEKHPICWYYKWLERRLIKSADFIGCPSQGNIDFALRYHPWAATKDIHILHYCQNPVVLPSTPQVDFRKRYNWEEKLVAIYGGSINIAQSIENVINLADSCREYDDIVFVIVGKGSHFDPIKQEVADRNIPNIVFLDYMPKEEYDELLSQCDIGIVSLNAKLQMPNIPSKTIGLFNLSKPILAAIDYSTDYGRYLENAGGGLWSYSGDTEALKTNLLKLYNDRELLNQMGKSGRAFYEQNLTPDNSYNTIINHINK